VILSAASDLFYDALHPKIVIKDATEEQIGAAKELAAVRDLIITPLSLLCLNRSKLMHPLLRTAT
jgi:hypothetical protein